MDEVHEEFSALVLSLREHQDGWEAQDLNNSQMDAYNQELELATGFAKDHWNVSGDAESRIGIKLSRSDTEIWLVSRHWVAASGLPIPLRVTIAIRNPNSGSHPLVRIFEKVSERGDKVETFVGDVNGAIEERTLPETEDELTNDAGCMTCKIVVGSLKSYGCKVLATGLIALLPVTGGFSLALGIGLGVVCGFVVDQWRPLNSSILCNYISQNTVGEAWCPDLPTACNLQRIEDGSDNCERCAGAMQCLDKTGCTTLLGALCSVLNLKGIPMSCSGLTEWAVRVFQQGLKLVCTDLHMAKCACTRLGHCAGSEAEPDCPSILTAP
jgi:hypothetical protein